MNAATPTIRLHRNNNHRQRSNNNNEHERRHPNNPPPPQQQQKKWPMPPQQAAATAITTWPSPPQQSRRYRAKPQQQRRPSHRRRTGVPMDDIGPSISMLVDPMVLTHHSLCSTIGTNETRHKLTTSTIEEPYCGVYYCNVYRHPGRPGPARGQARFVQAPRRPCLHRQLLQPSQYPLGQMRQ
jgi:hypothetical protein